MFSQEVWEWGHSERGKLRQKWDRASNCSSFSHCLCQASFPNYKTRKARLVKFCIIWDSWGSLIHPSTCTHTERERERPRIWYRMGKCQVFLPWLNSEAKSTLIFEFLNREMSREANCPVQSHRTVHMADYGLESSLLVPKQIFHIALILTPSMRACCRGSSAGSS